MREEESARWERARGCGAEGGGAGVVVPGNREGRRGQPRRAGETGTAVARRWMEEEWTDGRQEAGPGGAWWGGAARG